MDLLKVLESYRGKDRIIRLSSYILMLLGGRGNTPLQMKFRKISSELSGCRVVLRLFDDFAMLAFNLPKGFGFKEPNAILRPLEVVSAVLNQVYYPLEHIAWLRDKEVLPGHSGLFWVAGLVVWAGTLIVEIIKSLVKLRINSVKAQRLNKQKLLEKADERDLHTEQNQEIEDNLKKLAAENLDLVLYILQSAADLFNAINWLPKGILWSQRFSPSASGFSGIVATLCMLYRNWPTK